MNVRRLMAIGGSILLFLLTVKLIIFTAGEISRPTPGFVAAYAASHLLIEGEDMAQLYDDAWFYTQVTRFEPAVADIFINPPTTALLILPLVWLPYSAARAIWIITNVIGFVFMILWLTRQLHFSGMWLFAILIPVLLYQPVYANITDGQVYFFLLGLLLLSWHGYRQSKDGLLGGMLGLLLIFKLAGLFLWPMLLILKRWRAIAWGIGTTVLIILVTWPLMGTAAWQRHLITAFQANGKPERLVTAHQSWTSFSGHFFIVNQYNPEPLFNLAAAGRVLNLLGTITLLVASMFVVYKASRSSPTFANPASFSRDLSFSIFIILGIILSPLSLDYHYPLLLLPFGIVTAYVRAKGTAVHWVLLLFAFYLVAANLPYRSPRVANGLWAILAYPKLYGTLLLWGIAIWGVWQSSSQASGWLSQHPEKTKDRALNNQLQN